ncbi:MAG: hypothetical protein HYR85_02475 [Planctomycetes bacterium]|nr:hypothetical protein [Planctomycetota bacterium]MBI3846887.1 hypothetical protein [Planctomycetota bacterium]
MTYWIGKFLEAFGLVSVAAALVVGLQTDNIRLELSILAGGGAVFLLGRWLEKKGSAA